MQGRAQRGLGMWLLVDSNREVGMQVMEWELLGDSGTVPGKHFCSRVDSKDPDFKLSKTSCSLGSNLLCGVMFCNQPSLNCRASLLISFFISLNNKNNVLSFK